MFGRSWIVVALVAPMFAGCIDLAGSLEAPRPVWESGYTFSYVDEMTYDVHVEAEGEKEDESGSEGPFHYSAEVLNTTSGSGEPVYIVGYSGAPFMHEVGDVVDEVTGAWLLQVRQRDLAPVGFMVTPCDEDDGGCGPGTVQTFNMPNDYTYLDFPLTKGKSWGGMVGGGPGNAESMVDDGVGVRYEAKVRGTETVTTPLGEIRAVRVDFAYELVGMDELREEMEQGMREAGGRVERFNIDYDVTETAYYSPEYQYHAKHTVDANILIDLAFEPPQGDEVEVKVDVELTTKSLLEGASLVPKPERDLDDLTSIARGEIPLGQAKGSVIRPAGYRVDVEPKMVVVNAADSENVRIEGRVVGTSELPAQHTAQWRLEDFLGNQVGKGHGFVFDHQFNEPGQYRAILETHDKNGTVTAADAAFIYAEWHATKGTSCPRVAAEPFTSACETVPVPVRPGIRSLTVSAQEGDLTINPVSPEMRVRDADGNQATGSGNYVTISDFSGYTLDDEDWTAEYYHMGVSDGAVEYLIDLEYAPEPIARDAKKPDGGGGVVGGEFLSADWLLSLADGKSAAQIVTTTAARLLE